MRPIAILGVGVWGLGLEGWTASAAILAGRAPAVRRDSPPPSPSMLPPAERRRASATVRLALAAAQEACTMSGLSPDAVHAVFGTSNGDGVVVHTILEQITTGDRLVSPTQFHNSVHNAAAGYWMIGAGSRRPATCLGCHDATAGMALLKAAAEVEAEQAPVLLCVYDAPMPAPLSALRPTSQAFAAALVLAPEGVGTPLGRLRIRFASVGMKQGDEQIACATDENPASHLLPIMQSLARAVPASVELPVLDGVVVATVDPCSTDAAFSN